MLLKLRPFFFSLLFIVLLELITVRHGLALPVSIFLLLVSFFEGINIGRKWRYSVLPVFFSASSVSQLYLIGPFYEQQIFILISASMYYLSLFGAYRLREYSGDQTARGMISAATFATVFFTYSSLYGLYLNFLVPLFMLMAAYLVATLLISYQHLAIIHSNEKNIWIYSFTLALAMTELIWTMNFWPFGYLTTGIIALILYYVIWDVIQSHFLEYLTKKRVVANVVLFSFLITMVLLSSKWIPIK